MAPPIKPYDDCTYAEQRARVLASSERLSDRRPRVFMDAFLEVCGCVAAYRAFLTTEMTLQSRQEPFGASCTDQNTHKRQKMPNRVTVEDATE